MSPLSILFIIVIIIFILMLLRYIFVDPYTLQNIQNGKNTSTISASTLAKNGDAPASNFAYSIWFYVNDWNYRYGEPKVIFARMGAKSPNGAGDVDDINGYDPCPSVVLSPVENNITVSLGCFPGANEEPTSPGGNSVIHTCSVANVPIQKWVNLVISVYGRSMDLYIDGKLVRTCLLPGTANINNDADVHVTPLGGFDGWTSRLQFFPNSLNPQEVWNIYAKGYSTGLSMFNSYQVQLSILENGNTKSSVTI